MTTVNSIDQLLKLGNKYLFEDESHYDVELAKKYFKQAASLGSMDALLMLALIYDYDGQKELSQKCFEKLVNKRYGPAIYKIIIGEAEYELNENVDWKKIVYDWYERYRELQDGEKIRDYALLKLLSREKSDGHELLREAANCDDSQACYDLGRSHLLLEIKNSNLEEALHWLEKSVNLSNRFACRELGDFYLFGEVKPSSYGYKNGSLKVKPDHDLALEFYKKAILLGSYSVAVNCLYSYFKQGVFLQGNFNVVEKWLIYSAGHGEQRCMNVLGMEYASGINVSKNGHLAIYWLRRAAEFKDIEACLKLSEIYFCGEMTAKDFDETLVWFEKAVSHNEKQIDIDITFKVLKNLARNGFEVQCLEDIVLKMFNNLVLELALSESEYIGRYSYRVGLHYELGLGTAKDLSSARHYYELAVQNGYKRANSQLDKLISK
jgi:TPR repeat protein